MRKALFLGNLIIIILILMPMCFAKQGSLKLLAVQHDGEGNLSGSIADLHLELMPGRGRVFVDTFPLSKLDTQVSTRLAKEVACSYLDIHCDSFDFFYTIRAQSPIIAGPSAGAAITILTISLLGNIDISDDVTITGTINSGGIIGPVGGIKEKIMAASEDGITKVLIPMGERYIIKEDKPISNITRITEEYSDENINASEGNITGNEDISGNDGNITESDENITESDEDLLKEIDLVEFGRTLGIEVKEISDIEDTLYEFTGQHYEKYNQSIKIDAQYKQVMSKLASELCKRSDSLHEEALNLQTDIEDLEEKYQILYQVFINLTNKSKDAFEEERFYSSASYCFGANVKMGEIVLALQNESDELIKERIEKIEKNIEGFKKSEYKTITDLQAYMVVEERMNEAKNFLKKSRQNLAIGETDNARYNLAYAIERKFSSYAWSVFITGEGKTFRLSQEDISNSCQKKLSEAEERYQYVNLFMPGYLVNIRKRIDDAYSDFNNENYEACLFKAAKAKAEVDVILGVFGVEKKNIDNLIERKLEIVQKNIVKQAEKGIFPIIGFSYYEYANELKDSDQVSSLLYSEYALEMSNLDIYFPEKHTITFTDQDKREIGIFLVGIGTGMLWGIIMMIIAKRKKVK
ncbi:MAG: S16 family serine protease [Nanoarchaeota archaeon]|nr:S16 family serine protease [Nanoarchaeota archaeon]